MAQAGVVENEGALGGRRFCPPLYQQRYSLVISVCRRIRAEKVVDVGCGEGKLLRLLRREGSVQELVGVDVQASLLETQQHSLQPLTTDYLLPREQPLTVRLMQGSIAEPDQRLVGFDLLACVEVIEHLDPPVLEKVPFSIFGVLQPRVAVVTTPNADFNILFPNFHGFRHPDHRFEWTRAQFQAWCREVSQRYPYSVEFGGVGEPPAGKEHVGHCSQVATFTRTGDVHNGSQCGSPYRIVTECVHPHQQLLPPEQRLCHEAEYHLLQLLRQRLQGEEEEEEEEGLEGDEGEGECVKIKLEKLLQFDKIRLLCSSVEEIRTALLLSVVVRLEGLEAVFEVNSRYSDQELESDTEDSTVDCSTPACVPAADQENWD